MSERDKSGDEMSEQPAFDFSGASEVEVAFLDGRLSLLTFPVRRAGQCLHYEGRAIDHDEARTVHVMSAPAGGEIRGYVLMPDGSLHLRLPCYSGEWPEMDAAVRSRL